MQHQKNHVRLEVTQNLLYTHTTGQNPFVKRTRVTFATFVTECSYQLAYSIELF